MDVVPRLADLRIALPAVVAWVSAAVLIGVPEAAAFVLLGGAAVALACIVALVRHVLVVAAAVVFTAVSLVALVAVAVLVGDDRRTPDVVASQAGRTVDVAVVLDRDLGPADRSVLATLVRLGSADGLRVPVRVVPDRTDDAPAWAAGSSLVTRGAVEPDDPGKSTAYVVFLRGGAAVRPPDGLLRATDRARSAFASVTSSLPEPGGSLLRGLAIGDRSGLDPGTEAAMETSALTHLTAVSGDTVPNRGGSNGQAHPSNVSEREHFAAILHTDA